jgi:leucyl aminopeptidase (aminopeptidase T)
MAAVPDVVLDRCLGLRAGERLVIVTDPLMLADALVLQARGLEMGADAVVVVQSVLSNSTELPDPVAAALLVADVFVGLTSGSITHSSARVAATDRGARGVSMGGSTAEMLERMLAADLEAVALRSRLVAAVLDKGSEAHITCPRGTDLRLSLDGAQGHADDGNLRANGSFGNVPFGEGYAVPRDGEGVLVPSTIAGLGRVGGDTRLMVAGGRLVSVAGADGERLLAHLEPHGLLARNVAELGVGTHDSAELSGHTLEEEKLLGSVHIAFGASAALGGTISVPVHIDCVVLEAKLELDGIELRLPAADLANSAIEQLME